MCQFLIHVDGSYIKQLVTCYVGGFRLANRMRLAGSVKNPVIRIALRASCWINLPKRGGWGPQAGCARRFPGSCLLRGILTKGVDANPGVNEDRRDPDLSFPPPYVARALGKAPTRLAILAKSERGAR